MICLALTCATLDDNLALLRKHADLVDLAQLRLDLLTSTERDAVGTFPGRARAETGRPIPLICTVRRAEDGGAFAGAETERLQLLSDGVSARFDYVDLESDLRETSEGRAISTRARDAGCTIIRSIHFARGMPEGMEQTIRDLSDGGREVVLLAVTPDSTADLVELLAAADRTADVRKIVIGMGPYGTLARILSRRFGSMFTIVSDSDAVQAGPGHIGPGILSGRYQFGHLTPETPLFSVIGSPIAHSRSPEYHNGRFAADGIAACFVPILVDNVTAFFTLAERLPLRGSSVTLPHKEAVLPFLSEVDEGTTAAGSCNTIVRTRAGWRGVNTDVAGFLAPLLATLGKGRVPGPKDQQRTLSGIGATVVGAGGAARSIVYGLINEGARVLVLNRTPDRARALVSDLQPLAAAGGGSVELSSGPLVPGTKLDGHRDLFVQTTSLGMHGAGDPVPWVEFDGTEVVYDAVYTPPETPLIIRARSAGCRTITGDLMFDAQADAQYQMFSRLALA